MGHPVHLHFGEGKGWAARAGKKNGELRIFPADGVRILHHVPS